MTNVSYRICDFCKQTIHASEPFVCSVTTVTRNDSQKNFDCCEKCFNRLNAAPSYDTGVTPKDTDTPLQAAYRSGGVLWGQNET